jgi:hypothetical protein
MPGVLLVGVDYLVLICQLHIPKYYVVAETYLGLELDKLLTKNRQHSY